MARTTEEEQVYTNFFEMFSGEQISVEGNANSCKHYRLYPTNLVLHHAFTDARGIPPFVNKHFLKEIPLFTNQLLSTIAPHLQAPDYPRIFNSPLDVIAEVPGGAIRRLFFDDGSSMKAWGLLKNAAHMIMLNTDLDIRLTHVQRNVLNGFNEGPLDFDIKYYQGSSDLEETVREFISSREDPAISISSLTLHDGRKVIRAHLKPGTDQYTLDIAERLPDNDRERLLKDARKGPHQTSKISTMGLLIRDNDTHKTYIAFNTGDKSIQNGKSRIHFPEYQSLLDALHAFSKMLRVELLSPTKGELTGRDRYSVTKFNLRLPKLKTVTTLNKEVVQYRTAEFIREMLVCFTLSPGKTIEWMKMYGIDEALFPLGIPRSISEFNLTEYKPENQFTVMRALQALDPTGKIT
ncbi:hypothetical protein HY468_03190 [Candidatus Roizmanbacteria bacterium]|nr:hypothetical protein [Candidatus Roizmanbacteria bacterium]